MCGQDGREERPELTSSHGHTKIITIYRAAIYANDIKSRRSGSKLKSHLQFGAAFTVTILLLPCELNCTSSTLLPDVLKRCLSAEYLTKEVMR